MWIAFIKWMPIICLIDHFSETALVVFVSTIEKRLQNQVYRQWKANMDTFGSGKSSPFERVDFSLYRFSFSFSKSKQYSDPKLSSSLNLGLILHDLCLSCFLPARFTRMRASLQNQNKCKPSIKLKPKAEGMLHIM